MRSSAFFAASSLCASRRVLVKSSDCRIRTIVAEKPSPAKLTQKSDHIVVGDGDHEKHDERDTERVHGLEYELRGRTAHEGLYAELHQTTSVERRNGKQIDDGKVDGNECCECQDISGAILRRISHDPNETDRADDLRDGRSSRESALHTSPHLL